MTNNMYCTIDEVKRITGIKPKHFKIENDTELDTIIETWIIQSMSIIDEYCQQSFTTENIPGGVSIACVQIVANIITNAESRKNSPLVKVNDWTVTTVPTEIFTKPIKELLKPCTKTDERYEKAQIEFLTITGDSK